MVSYATPALMRQQQHQGRRRRRMGTTNHDAVVCHSPATAFSGGGGRMMILLPVVFAVVHLSAVVHGGEAELTALMERMESDVLDLAREYERVYANRCSSSTLAECDRGSYDACTSEYPHQTCPGIDDNNDDGDGGGSAMFAIPDCGDGTTCGGLFDFTVSSVRVAENAPGGLDDYGDPYGDVVREAVCYTLQAEEYMVEKHVNDSSLLYNGNSTDGEVDELDVMVTNTTTVTGDTYHPTQMYFGSSVGAFRIYPARQSHVCGEYDNTQRPWYVAASSGPKDVILVLDTSGSMARKGRLDLMKKAAKRVVETLTVGDHVAIITFGSDALVRTEDWDYNTLVQATSENKAKLVNLIDEVEANGGGTNYYAGFELAYDVLDVSREKDKSSMCQTAILFLTDGQMSPEYNVTADDVIDLISQRDEELGTDAHLFLYSLGREAKWGDAASVTKRIACSAPGRGMWSHVDDYGDLASAMANYYKHFAMGLGNDANEGFVAWVEPYPYATGGVMGTTVSAPVYDRTVDPPIFVGVVGIDLTLDVMDRALSENEDENENDSDHSIFPLPLPWLRGDGDAVVDVRSNLRDELLDRLVRRSTTVCPRLNLTECAVQGLRHSAGGDESLCEGECSDFVGISAEACGAESDYPANLWANSDNSGRAYEERVCCSVGETRVGGNLFFEDILSQQCIYGEVNPPSGIKSDGSLPIDPKVIAGAFVAIALIIACVAGYCYCCRKTTEDDEAVKAGSHETALHIDQVACLSSETPVKSVTVLPAWRNGDDAKAVEEPGSIRDLPVAIAPVAIPVPVMATTTYPMAPATTPATSPTLPSSGYDTRLY